MFFHILASVSPNTKHYLSTDSEHRVQPTELPASLSAALRCFLVVSLLSISLILMCKNHCTFWTSASHAKVLHFVSFSLIVRPTILNSGNHSSEVVVIRGNNISLECKVQGNPQPAITWMKDGHPLVNGRGVEILNDGHLLQLKNAHVSDTGRYVCVAVNVAGLTDRKYDLNIHGE